MGSEDSELFARGFGVQGEKMLQAEVVALQCLHEGLAHAVALGARHRREAGNEVELGGEDTGVTGSVDQAIIGEPLHRMRGTDAAEAGLHGFEHHVADVGTADPGVRDGAPGDDLTVVGVENEGAADDLAVPSRANSKPSEQ